MSVRIVDVREVTKPIASPIRNAYIDFTKMTTSLVAVVTDVVRDGKRGGRLRLQFQRPLRAGRPDPRALCAAPDGGRSRRRCSMRAGDNLDPDRIWATLMSNEKPGGHGERSVAVGTIDMAVWDAVAKIAGKPLFRLLAERHGATADPRVFVYAAGGYYYPGKDLSMLRGEMRGYLDRGYNVVKMKIGGAPIEEDRAAHRGRAGGDRQGRAARRRRQRPLRSRDRDRLRQDAARLSAVLVRGGRRSARLLSCRRRWRNSIPAPMATGENLFSHQDARNLLRYGGMRPDRDWLQFDCALSYGLCEYQRTLEVLKTAGWSPSRCIPHGGHQMSLNIAAGLGLGGNESYPDLFQPYGGFPDGVRVENGHITMPDLPGIGFEGKSDLYAEMKALAE